MDLVIAVLLLIAPTLIDLGVQYVIHKRTVKYISACPYCPHAKEVEAHAE